LAPISFNRAVVMGQELRYLGEAIASSHICGNGSFTKRCSELLQRILPAPKVLLTTSCTHALEMAALLLHLTPGDEIIVPSFTFVSTANAFALMGAKPIFCDIRSDTLNLDEELLPSLVSSRTRAIVPVHYAGVGCQMDSIVAFAKASGLAIIEDNAHGLFGKFRGKALGTFGCLATQSFHETKNITCGEGGALIINSTELMDRAEIIHEKGTNRSRFFRGQIDKYTWVDLGSSYLPSEMLAAYLLAQLEARERVQSRREAIWKFYFGSLAEWANGHGVALPHVPDTCEHPFHMFYLLMPSLVSRQGFIEHLRSHNIQSTFHYVPLHLSIMGRKFGGREGDCPVAENISDRLVRLPLHCGLSDADLSRIVSRVLTFDPSVG